MCIVKKRDGQARDKLSIRRKRRKKRKRKRMILSNPFAWSVWQSVTLTVYPSVLLIRFRATLNHLLMGVHNILKLFV